MGQANVGYLLGVGRTDDKRFGPSVLVSWLYGAVDGNGG